MHALFLLHRCNLQKIKVPVILLYDNLLNKKNQSKEQGFHIVKIPASFNRHFFCFSLFRTKNFPLSIKNKPALFRHHFSTAFRLRLDAGFLKLLFKIYPGAEDRKNENTLLIRQPEYYESQYLHYGSSYVIRQEACQLLPYGRLKTEL